MKMNLQIVKRLGLLLFSCLVLVNFSNAQSVNDSDLKLNREKINNAQQLIADLSPITFDYNQDQFKKMNLPTGKQYGFLIDSDQKDVEGLIVKESKVVGAGKNATKVVNYDEVDDKAVIVLLVSAVKEQQQEIEKLKSEIESLKSK